MKGKVCGKVGRVFFLGGWGWGGGGGGTVLASRERLAKAFAGTCLWLECVR